MIELKNYNGLLFVGDPHITIKHKRMRLDENICDTILNKIEQAVDIANKENLYLVFLGDLFDDSKEQDYNMMTKLIRILNQLRTPAATVEGNHEKTKTKLTDEVGLKLLQEAKCLYVMEKNDLWAKMKIDNKTYYIGSTPYGEKIPNEVNIPVKQGSGEIIWLTHHNLDFGNSYPGVVPIHQIKNVSMLVNGHIHQTKKSKIIGNMVAHNPGNITRQTTDCNDHIPSVWKWIPEQKYELEPIVLKHEKHVFDLTGKQVLINYDESDIPLDLTPQQSSSFVTHMQELQYNEPHQTQDGDYMANTIKTFAKAIRTNDDFTQDILDILKETMNSTSK